MAGSHWVPEDGGEASPRPTSFYITYALCIQWIQSRNFINLSVVLNLIEGVVAQWCNPLTLQSEQSRRVGSIPGRAPPLERHDKGSRTRLALRYFRDTSSWRQKPQSHLHLHFSTDFVVRMSLREKWQEKKNSSLASIPIAYPNGKNMNQNGDLHHLFLFTKKFYIKNPPSPHPSKVCLSKSRSNRTILSYST